MEPYRKIIKIGIIEVGDYSLYIDLIVNNIDEASVFKIQSELNYRYYEAKEVIITGRKCITYFDEPIKSLFYVGIRWVYISNAPDTYWMTKDFADWNRKSYEEFERFAGIYYNKY